MAALAMAHPGVSFRVPALPWSAIADDERRFKRILGRVLALVLLLGVVLPFVPLRQAQRIEAQPLPPPIARLLLERRTPPPPPPKPAEAPVDSATKPQAPADKPVPQVAAKPRPVPEARKPEPGKAPGEVALDNARRKASGVGLLALKNELAEMTGAPLAVQLKQDIRPGPGVGTATGPGVGAGTEPGVPVRAMITSNATKGSGGINTAGYSRDTGGGGLAGRATTLVEGVAGGGGGGGPGGGGGSRAGGAGGSAQAGAGAAAGGTLHKGSSGRASRSIEEIKLVFERNKGAIYALYNRALREDPALQGKVVLELKIAPGGQVADLRIVSSELKADELEKKLLARIRQFDFGAKDVEVMVVTWPVDFLPS
ncbi:Energy transducer TonB [Rubrivivax sp. A210]|uniref:TonB family protein n=1 Tax=Rubrivivax sp. A210 TaxID=2772301 RepID=UPI00199A5EB9|nr:TonB family protein [Rubrivivax sp. A210]CAD5374958.1 Energy transducer TonB [Rubrivivax sp. A210]